MTEAHLSSRDNYAIAVFGGPDSQFNIVLGNIPEGDVPGVNDLLSAEATEHFGRVEASGSAKGSVSGRWDAWVTVKGDQQQVLAFVRERLKGCANQLKPRKAQ